MTSVFRRWAAMGAALAGAACARQAPIPLFESRVSTPPLLQKLQASGGDPSRILHPRRAADLAALETAKRYKFVVVADGGLAVAPIPADALGNEYVHAVLAGGGPVRTAGGIRVDHDGPTLRRITVDQDSRAYCPSAASLSAALAALQRLGAPARILRAENRPPLCEGAPPVVRPRYGTLMTEVGRRFETLGRATQARRYELADYELDELGEVFREDLPQAEPPRESAGVNLAGVADAFVKTNLPDLDQALRSRDPTAFKAAYERAAQTCNGCHQASGHRFVEVPKQPGALVPRLDPLP
jgi:hypothetical protein